MVEEEIAGKTCISEGDKVGWWGAILVFIEDIEGFYGAHGVFVLSRAPSVLLESHRLRLQALNRFCIEWTPLESSVSDFVMGSKSANLPVRAPSS